MPLERLTTQLVAEIAEAYPTLSNLNLSSNAIREMDCDLSMLPYVSRLNLNHNQLSSVPSTLAAHLPHLTQLLLGHNQLYVIGDLSHSIKTLTVLDLSFNSIAPFDQLDYLKDLSLLAQLTLQGNSKLDQVESYRLEQKVLQMTCLPREITPREREAARKLAKPAILQPLQMNQPPQRFVVSAPLPPVQTSTPIQTPPPVKFVSPPVVPKLTTSDKQLELLQHRVEALQEVIALHEAEVASATGSSQANSQTMQRLVAKWRVKVYELLVDLKRQKIEAADGVHQAAIGMANLEKQKADQSRYISSLNQRLVDADAAMQLLHLQVKQLETEKSALAAKCHKQIHGLETERQHTRHIAHRVISLVQDDAMVERLQRMYSGVSSHEQRLARQVEQVEMLVISLARKEARLRNQEAALEGERRVWIKRLQGADSSPSVVTTIPKSKTFRLKPDTEEVLRAVFQRLDPYQTGLVASDRFLQALQKDWTIRQVMGVAAQCKLVDLVQQNGLFARTKYLTWGEFVLLFLPDLSPQENIDVPCQDNGIPHPFDTDEVQTSQNLTKKVMKLHEWSREMLESRVCELEQERIGLVARLKQDAKDLQHRVVKVHQQWQDKCNQFVESLALLQDTVRKQEHQIESQIKVQKDLEGQLASLRTQSNQQDNTLQRQLRELENKLQVVSREHDREVLRLQEAHADALQEAEQKARQAQKDYAKQDVYIRQLERQLKRMHDAAADEEKEQHQSLVRQIEKRDVEIGKLRRERNALLTTLREQEKKPLPTMLDQCTSTEPLVNVQDTKSPPEPTIPKTRPIPTRVGPQTLSHRLMALSTQANRWLSDDEWCSDDER
ncbi:hypothetical protein Ae201684P_014013 [Aphanomyces euteiches]|nr:hypothetical protein Ae201684P_014013 [Aphanomyces euteiches]